MPKIYKLANRQKQREESIKSYNLLKQGKMDGLIIACKQHDQYLVKVQGSGKLTLRNRRFLRKFQIRSPVVQNLGSGAVKDGLSTVQNHIVKDSAQPQKKISA